MKIYVRRRHIDRGKAGKSTVCPIALAISEATNEQTSVGWDCVWFCGSYKELPRAATRFIYRFDSGKPVKPFAFTIRA